jgi:hypothetical protein
LEEHAKILEGWKAEMAKETSQSAKSTGQPESVTPPPVMPTERKEAESSVKRPKETQAVKAMVSETNPSPSPKPISKAEATDKGNPPISQTVKEAEPKGLLEGKGKSKEIIPEISSNGAKAGNPEVKSLANALSQFMETQNALAQATGKNLMPTGNPAEVVSSLPFLIT